MLLGNIINGLEVSEIDLQRNSEDLKQPYFDQHGAEGKFSF